MLTLSDIYKNMNYQSLNYQECTVFPQSASAQRDTCLGWSSSHILHKYKQIFLKAQLVL